MQMVCVHASNHRQSGLVNLPDCPGHLVHVEAPGSVEVTLPYRKHKSGVHSLAPSLKSTESRQWKGNDSDADRHRIKFKFRLEDSNLLCTAGHLQRRDSEGIENKHLHTNQHQNSFQVDMESNHFEWPLQNPQ
jgi:hypothetical protein